MWNFTYIRRKEPLIKSNVTACKATRVVLRVAARSSTLARFMQASISLCDAHAQLSELEAKGKVLPASSSDYKVVQKIADRVIKAVEAGRGGGFQDHVSKCALPVTMAAAGYCLARSTC